MTTFRLALLATLLGAATARAQDPVVDDLFAPPAEEAPAEAAPAEEAPAEEAPAEAPPAEALPAPSAEPSAAAPAPAPEPVPVVEAPAPPPRRDDRTIAERGGLFGIGLVVAPKVGAGLGSIVLEGLGATPLMEVELGYALPFELVRGRDLQVFTAWGYTGPRGGGTVEAKDPRLPGDGSFTYSLTIHQLNGTTGALYRIPVDVVPWWRAYGWLGVRTIWSWTVIEGDADGEAFGTYVEQAFDVGGAGAVGSDFYFGPGAICAELQLAVSGADRFVLRDTTNTAMQVAVGYRFFL